MARHKSGFTGFTNNTPNSRIIVINNYYGLITDILITFISVLRI